MANIILDYDGTIHDCAKIYVPAFYIGYKYLTDKGLAPVHDYSYEEVSSYLGYSVKDMWNRFMPELPQEEKDICGKIISDEMMKMIENGKSVLYDGAEKVLKILKEKGHNLIFLSNCTHSYMKAHIAAHKLDRFYSGFYCTEDFGFKSKPEIFKSIKENYDGKFIVAGDRFLDLEIAEVHNLKSVGCLYGYCEKNELCNASVKISDISKLPDAIDCIL